MNYLKLTADHGCQIDQSTPRTYVSGRRKAKHYVISDLYTVDFAGDEKNVAAVCIAIKLPIPPLSPNDMGDLGEEIGRLLLAYESGQLGTPTKRGSLYDLDIVNDRIDFKFSALGQLKKNYPGWKFNLSHSKLDPKTGKYVKVRKDYSLSCSNLVLIGVNEDGGLTLFIVPSSSPEIRNLDNIKIPYNFERSKWAKYWYDPSYLVGPPNRTIPTINELMSKYQQV